MKNKQICPDCDTGRKSYLFDKHSEACPHILEISISTEGDGKFFCPHFKVIGNVNAGVK